MLILSEERATITEGKYIQMDENQLDIIKAIANDHTQNHNLENLRYGFR